mgnify:CR=1 FL=1
MPKPYNAYFEVGDGFQLAGRFQVVMDKRVEDGETQYLLSEKGRKRWKAAALIDRDATSFDYTLDE